jgi:hypothetical protein
MRLFNPENAHWYRRDGEPLHSVPSARGEPRPTTLRDARKLGLLPSVTNVLGVIAKPELVEWKMTQAVLAALTLPRLNGEGEDEFAKRVVEDAQSRVRTAVDFGSAFHAGAELVAKSLEVDPAGPYAAWLNHHRSWFQANCVRLMWTERVLVNGELGYAGTADLLIEHQSYGVTLVDYKTQGVKPGNTARAYGSWCQQLAAYRRALGKPMACLSVIVNSAEPSAPVEHLWTEEELEAGWESFEAATVIWRNEKNYDPRGSHTGSDAQKQTKGTKREEGAPPVLVAG